MVRGGWQHPDLFDFLMDETDRTFIVAGDFHPVAIIDDRKFF